MFIHAMGNAHVMFQFVSDTNESAQSMIDLFIGALVENEIIHSKRADTDVEIGVDVVEKLVLSRLWVWVALDKMVALHAAAALIPTKV